jgi:hypothetical protein
VRAAVADAVKALADAEHADRAAADLDDPALAGREAAQGATTTLIPTHSTQPYAR